MSDQSFTINSKLRLRPYRPADLLQALSWYSDPVVLDGAIRPDRKEPCSTEMISAMYSDLSKRGDLFIIEAAMGSVWIAIGDVTLSQETMPIVIGDRNFRGKGIASQVIRFLLLEARKGGWDQITLKEIYKGNLASQRLFEACGFEKTGEEDQSFIYEIQL